MLIKQMVSSKTPEHFTPPDLFNKLNKIYNFYTDPCTTVNNPLNCKLFFTKEDDGCNYNKWVGNVFINPPYGAREIYRWLTQAWMYTTLKNDQFSVVMLLPVRTTVDWFQEALLHKKTKLYFFNHRVKFQGWKSGAPFDSILLLINDFNFEGKIVQIDL